MGDSAYQTSSDALPEPLLNLLRPAWLLADYELTLGAPSSQAGRAGQAAVGSVRQTSRGRLQLPKPSQRVSLLIDTELGILLRYAKGADGRDEQQAEFTELVISVGAAADAALFVLPVRAGSEQSARPPRAELDRDELSPDLVNLLYRSERPPLRCSATLREVSDGPASARAARRAMDAASPAGPARWLARFNEDHPPESAELVAEIALAMPGCYRIDELGERAGSPSVVCDGVRVWRIFADRIVDKPATPPPAGLCLIIDPAWLLSGYQLSTAGPTTVAGRAGVTVIAVPGPDTGELRQGPLSGASVVADRIEAVIDTSLGIVVRQAWLAGGDTLLTTELADLTEDVGAEAFLLAARPGVRLISDAGPLADTGLSPGAATRQLAGGAARAAGDVIRWLGRSARDGKGQPDRPS